MRAAGVGVAVDVGEACASAARLLEEMTGAFVDEHPVTATSRARAVAAKRAERWRTEASVGRRAALWMET